MAKKSVSDYVRGMLQKGYNIPSIKNELLRYGYSNNEIDEAIRSSYIKHEIHLSKTTASIAIFFLISLIVVASFYYFKPLNNSKLLDLNLEPVSTTVAAGEDIVFIKELSNLGSAQKYDVVIEQEIIEPKTNKVITQKIETRGIETFGSTQTKILIPLDAAPGSYILRAVVEYDNKKAVATLPIKIIAAAKQETCSDGIKNQNEDGIDCGGFCNECGQQVQCDDFNPCTDDAVENGVCVNKLIAPCCGNNVCEEAEQETCATDCKKQDVILPSSETLDNIKEIAKTNPGKAFQECSKMEVPDIKDTCISNIAEVQASKAYCNQIAAQRIKDLCLSNIAQLVNDNSICEEIYAEARKDSCYSNFFIFSKDYSVCPKISNKALRESCEQLRQAEEYNKEIDALQNQE